MQFRHATRTGYISSAPLMILILVCFLSSIISNTLNFYDMNNNIINTLKKKLLSSFIYIMFTVFIHLTPGLFSGALYA